MLRGLELGAVLDHLTEGLVVVSLDGGSLHWNRAVLAMHGLTSADDVTRAKFMHMFALSTLAGERVDPAGWPLPRILAGEVVQPIDLRIERVGHPWSRIFRYHGAIVRGVGGARDLALLHVTDVTEQHRDRLTLIREGERHALLLAAARILVGVERIGGPEVAALHGEVLQHVGGAMLLHCRLRPHSNTLERVVSIGVPEAAIADLPQRPLDSTLSGGIVLAGTSLVLNAEQFERDRRTAHARDLGARALVGHALRARDGRVVGSLVFVRALDTSFSADEVRFLETYSHLVATAMERLDADAALRERDAQLRILLSQAPVILWSTDHELKVTWVDGLALGRVGLDPAAVIGKRIGDMFRDPAILGGRQRQVLTGQTVEYDVELGPLAMRGVLVPLRDGDGAVVGTVGVAVDVTEVRLVERSLRQHNVELEEQVVERTAELRAANAELESFAYAVAHDLRAPLRAVAGFTRAVLEDFGTLLPADGQDMLGDVIAASHTMSDLIDGLLALSRLSRSELAHDPIDLSALAHDLVRELERAEPARRVAITIEPDLHARGDRRLVEALLRNLLHNAWKYSARTAAATIAVRAEIRGGVPGFAVIDNGAGFAMDHAGKLFLPFQRLHRQDEFPGLGLGLATGLRIVRRHGGTIVGTGAHGAGACFWFTLAPPPAPEAP